MICAAKNISEITTEYRILAKNKKEEQYYLSWLYDYKSDEMVTKKIAIGYSDFIRLKENDTIKVKFIKGWFGIKHTPKFLK